MSSKGILGFLLGSAVGAAFGLLTTPRSGKENQLAVKEYIDGTLRFSFDLCNTTKEIDIVCNEIERIVKIILHHF